MSSWVQTKRDKVPAWVLFQWPRCGEVASRVPHCTQLVTFFIYCPLRPLRTSWVSHCAHNRLTDMNQPWPRHSKCLSSTLTITNHFSQIGHENKIYGEHKLAHVMSCGIKSCLGPTVKTDMKSASESLSPASVFSQRGFLSTSEDCGCQRLSAVLLTQSSERNESLTPSKLRPFSPQTFSETI